MKVMRRIRWLSIMKKVKIYVELITNIIILFLLSLCKSDNIIYINMAFCESEVTNVTKSLMICTIYDFHNREWVRRKSTQTR